MDKAINGNAFGLLAARILKFRNILNILYMINSVVYTGEYMLGIHSITPAVAKINFESNKANKCSQAYQAIECRV